MNTRAEMDRLVAAAPAETGVSVEIEEKTADGRSDRLRPEPRAEPLVFERSGEGKVGYSLPPLDVPPRRSRSPRRSVRGEIAGETEITEVEVARHFTRLSRLNFSIDQGLYPLGLLHDEAQPADERGDGAAAGLRRGASARPRGRLPGRPRARVDGSSGSWRS